MNWLKGLQVLGFLGGHFNTISHPSEKKDRSARANGVGCSFKTWFLRSYFCDLKFKIPNFAWGRGTLLKRLIELSVMMIGRWSFLSLRFSTCRELILITVLYWLVLLGLQRFLVSWLSDNRFLGICCKKLVERWWLCTFGQYLCDGGTSLE